MVQRVATCVYASGMTTKPELLDLFACEGLGSEGYAQAGFDVSAVDNDKNRLKYNPHKWLVEDAYRVLEREGKTFDAIHASPPCQGYSRGNAMNETTWSRDIPKVREALEATGKPYVIENVVDAGYDMIDPVRLCGCMWDLKTVDTDNIVIHMERARLFETNWNLTPPGKCEGEGQPRWNHPSHEWVGGAYGGARRDKYEARYIRKGGYVPPDMHVLKALMGVEHKVTWKGLFEGLPPVFTRHVGSQLIELV